MTDTAPTGAATNHDHIPADVFNTAMMAAFPGLPDGMSLDEAGRRIAAALNAVTPLIEQRALGRWHPEYETYEVLVGDTVYEECDTLGQVTRAVVNAFDEIRADELIGDVRTRRISRHLRAENDPS